MVIQPGSKARLCTLSAMLAGSLLLASCGGGDPYAGLWPGSMAGTREVNTIVLGDGSYYMLYSRSGTPNRIEGFVKGVADFDGGRFSSAGAVDYNMAVPGSYAVPAAISARIGGAGGRPAVSGAVNGRSFGISYDHKFDGNAQLAAVAGNFQGEVVFLLGPRPAVLNVTSTGAVSTVVNFCQIQGQATPRQDANVFDLVVTLGAYPCFAPGAQLSGVAIYRPETGRLDAAVTHAFLPTGIAFTGSKQ